MKKNKLNNELFEKIINDNDLMQYKVNNNKSKWVIMTLENHKMNSKVIIYKNNKGEPSSISYQGSNPDFFKDLIIELDKKKSFVVFVVMRFLPKHDNWFNFIKDYLYKKYNLSVKRLDSENSTRVLDNKLYDLMENCHFAIINTSDMNANLGFEFGYLAKRFINHKNLEFNKLIVVRNKLLCDIKDMPFDINHITEISYEKENSPQFLSELDFAIEQILKEIKTNDLKSYD